MHQFIMGLDVGYGNTKAVYSTESGVEHNLVLPSVAHEILDLQHYRDMSATGKTDQTLITVEDRHFVVGPSASVFGRTLHDNYILTPQYHALVAGALHSAFEELGDATEEVDSMVVGLPVYAFSRLKDQLREQMLKPFVVPLPAALRSRFGGESLTVRIKSVRVMPQPVGSVTDWRSRATAQIDAQDIVTVCDPGYKTFDWFSMRGSVVVPELSGAFDGGGSELLKDVSVAITRQHPNALLDIQSIEEGMERKTMMMVGIGRIEFEPFRPIIGKGARVIVRRMADMLQRAQQEKKSRIDHLVLAGGGATYFEAAVREVFTGFALTVLPRPVLSNARGFWLLAARALATAKQSA
jgi:plasmid segregation protein ParM